MTWTAAGFGDHHNHMLTFAAGVPLHRADMAAHHRHLASIGSSPSDEPWTMPKAPDDACKAVVTTAQKLAKQGWGYLCDPGLSDWTTFDLLQQLHDENRLGLSVDTYVLSGLAHSTGAGATAARMGQGVGLLGVKFYADGWLGQCTCATSRPFRNDDNGILFRSAIDLARAMEPFAERGLRLATHAIGDRAIEATLDAYAMVYGSPAATSAQQPRIEHVQLLRPDLVDRMAEWGVVACIQPSFAHQDAAAFSELGDASQLLAYNWRWLQRQGVQILIGTDAPFGSSSAVSALADLCRPSSFEGSDFDVATALDLMSSPKARPVALSHDPNAVDVELLGEVVTVC